VLYCRGERFLGILEVVRKETNMADVLTGFVRNGVIRLTIR
jgi:hypothetical protein